MQLFSADSIVFSKKFKFLFDPKNMKKLPTNIAHNRPQNFFYVLAWLAKWPRNRNLVLPKAPNTGYLDWI